MHRAHAGALAPQRAADVHQARVVGRRADLGARVEHVAQLVGEHRHRGVGVLDRERAAEAAALARALELDEVDALRRRAAAAAAGRRLAAAAASGRSGGSVTRCGNDGADVLDAEAVDEELGQLEDAAPTPVLAQVRDARRATARRPPRSPRTRARSARPARRLVGVARVAVHLPAARLLLGELDLAPEPLQQLDDRPARPREQRVVEAGDEERDPHLVAERSLSRGGGGPPEGSRHVPAGLRPGQRFARPELDLRRAAADHAVRTARRLPRDRVDRGADRARGGVAGLDPRLRRAGRAGARHGRSRARRSASSRSCGSSSTRSGSTT